MCLSPLTMYWTGRYTATGKKDYTFSRNNGYEDTAIEVPCGKCIECLNDKRGENSVRMVHEASCYSANCFITLTVDDEHLEQVFPGGSLRKTYMQKFLKNLRLTQKGVDLVAKPRWWNDTQRRRWNEYPIRCVYCGEYGGRFGRPHYHAILFNYWPSDAKLVVDNGDNSLFESKTLQALWPYGFVTIGQVSFGSCAYVAGYVLKKQLKDVKYVDADTGVVREREFVQYPSGFGLGRLWLDKFHTDISNYGEFVQNGYQKKIPKFYKKKLDNENGMVYKLNHRARKMKSAPKSSPYVKGKILAQKLEKVIKR